MQRYDIVGADWEIEEHPDGGWVEQEEAAAAIAAAQSRIADLERCLKTALEFVPKSVAKRLTAQGGLE